MRLLVVTSLLASVALAPPAAAQTKGTPPTKRQRESLEPLITSLARRLELHLSSVLAKDAERTLRKALLNQNSDVAERKLKELFTELLLADLDASKKDAKMVEYDLLPEFGKSFTALNQAFADLEEPVKATPKQEYIYDRFVSSSYLWTLDHPLLFSLQGVRLHHWQCLRHQSGVQAKLKEWARAYELDKDQERGVKELAAYTSDKIQDVFRVERKDRRFAELIASALATNDTDRALLCTLAKIRHLIRPIVWKVHEVGDRLEARLAAEEHVDARIEKELTEAAWWTRLRTDHEAVLRDPKAFRKLLAERKKAER